MDLEFSDEQVLLAETAATFVARECPPTRVRRIEAAENWFDEDLWKSMGRLGWCALALPVEHGGLGRGLLEVAVLAEQLGAGPLPSPLLTSTTFAALPILWAGSDAQRARLLPGLATGDRIGTLAVVETTLPDLWGEVQTVGGRPLSGTKLTVPWAGVADTLIVATADGPWLVEPDRGGVSCERHDAFAGDPLYAVTLNNVDAEPLGDPDRPAGPDVTRRALDAAAIVGLAYAVGAAEACLDSSVQHASERVQFGRPIGSFQAVAHRCVDMRTDIDACRLLAYEAAWAIDRGRDATVPVTAALTYASGALRRVFLHAHQVHGASGFSTETDLHLFTRRLEAFVVTFAAPSSHGDRLAAAMGLTGAADAARPA